MKEKKQISFDSVDALKEWLEGKQSEFSDYGEFDDWLMEYCEETEIYVSNLKTYWDYWDIIEL